VFGVEDDQGRQVDWTPSSAGYISLGKVITIVPKCCIVEGQEQLVPKLVAKDSRSLHSQS
jgi:hypothetical protein